MSTITIDLTDADPEDVTLENVAGFDWVISLGDMQVTITDAQLMALVDAVKKWGDE